MPSEIRVTLYRCKGTDGERGPLASDGRCAHWTFGPDWRCPFHMDDGVEAFPMAPAAEVEQWRTRAGAAAELLDGVMVGHTPRNPHAHVFSTGERADLEGCLLILRGGDDETAERLYARASNPDGGASSG